MGDAPEPLPAERPHTGPRRFLPSLQSLRGLAALWVVLYHVDLALAGAHAPLLGISGLRVGWLGVDLFFVLSAYLLGQPYFEGRGQPPGRFFADRFLRIAPAYYAAAVLSAAVTVAVGPGKWDPAAAWPTLVFLNNFNDATLFAVNPVFWSLAVEMQFYLLLPWMARLFTGRRWPWGLAACVAAATLFRGVGYVYGGHLGLVAGSFWLPSFLAHFGLGLAAARLRSVPNPFLASAAGVVLAGLPVALLVPRTSLTFGYETLAGQVVVRPIVAAGFALLVLAAASAGTVRRALEVAPLRALGDISYSLYLAHIPVLQVVLWAVGLPDRRTEFILVSVGASLVYGAVLYGLVERPAELWRRRRKAAQAAAP